MTEYRKKNESNKKSLFSGDTVIGVKKNMKKMKKKKKKKKKMKKDRVILTISPRQLVAR
jgi:protoporphyrinogen oxidase